MHKKFDHKQIEEKWQEKWKADKLYDVGERDEAKEKEYVLVEWPYPSGNLHIGHWHAFAVPDIYVRYQRMLGKQVFFPMGFDAFGLPAENAAIKRNLNPREWTESNIEYMKGQLESMGNAFSWDKTCNSTDPEYYKWTQWMFTQFFEHDLAYRGEAVVNWDPVDNTVIANEQVLADGTSERSGAVVEKKVMPQWMLRITDFADELVDDLEDLDWPHAIKESQRNWIGRSEGAEIDFEFNINTEKPKVLIIHGFAGDPSEGWKPWLKKELEERGYEVRSPKMPNFEHPDYDECMSFLEEQITDFTENDIIIGHSLGGHFALKLAEKGRYEKVILVAPTIGGFEMPYADWKKNDPQYEFDTCEKILESEPVDFKKVHATEKIAIFGETDRGIPISHADLLDKSWTVIKKPQTGHMSVEKEVSEILQATLDTITVFTTRPDTLFGATYMVLAPEHELVQKHKDKITNWKEVEAYITASKQKEEQDRLDATKEKTGVKLGGVTATNPANDEEIPVYIADYVLASYGTGAIMAVPAHDERDFAFAKKFEIEIRQVIGQIYNKEEKVTVHRKGVYGLITNEKGEYLLQHCAAGNFYWLPGGTLEENEEELSCLKRELSEETGFSNLLSTEKLVTVFFDRKSRSDNEPARKQITVYKVSVNANDQGEMTLTEQEIADGMTIGWVKPEEVLELLAKENHVRSQLVADIISHNSEAATTESGALLNSDNFDGMDSEEAKAAITEKVGGRMTNTYRLRDWSIGRQRYWGVPIPIVYDPEGKAHVVPKEHLPWRLPEDVDFKPTGEAPLAKSAELKKRTEEIFGKGWTPEVETMDTFVDSSWYYLRYIDNQNDEEFSSKAAQKDWLPIDLYFGGAEHTTMHLLYSRFWQKALNRLGLAEHAEPYTRRFNRGLILGPDGNKMSKSKGNVIDPDEQVALVGADTVKMYLAFMGPYAEVANYPWDMGGIAGLRRFLERVYGLSEHIVEKESAETTRQLHKTIKKVAEDIEVFKFNTAISAMMVFVNQVEKAGLSAASYDSFLRLLAPFATHLSEELWTKAGNSSSIHSTEFPAYDSALAKDSEVTIGVQINGKMRGEITISPDATEAEALEAVHQNETLAEKLANQETKKVIYVPGRILNLVMAD